MDEMHNGKAQKAVAMDCEMVGGGSDGSIDLCARVCLVDEDENIILHTYVQPQIHVTNYRYFYAPSSLKIATLKPNYLSWLYSYIYADMK